MIVALLLSTCLSSFPDDAAVPLFDGKTLDGWVVEGTAEQKKDGALAPVWSVKDGMLTCRGQGFGFLRFKDREFENFTLHLEYRLAKGCNSGVGVRTTAFDPKKSNATRPSFYSYEIQLLDDAGKPTSPLSTGSLYRYVAAKENPSRPAGEWNEMEITCEGPKIKVVLNGKTIQDVDQSEKENLKTKPLKGYVCLQNHGGDVAFRQVNVRPLNSSHGAYEPAAK